MFWARSNWKCHSKGDRWQGRQWVGGVPTVGRGFQDRGCTTVGTQQTFAEWRMHPMMHPSSESLPSAMASVTPAKSP